MYEVQPNGKGQADQMSIDSGPRMSLETFEEEYAISVKELLQVIRRWIWAVALVMCILTASAVGLSLLQTPEYGASIKILVGQKQGDEAPVNLGSDVEGLQQLTLTVAEVIPTRPVAEGVIKQLDLRTTPEELLEDVSVEQVTDTQVVEVSYRDTDPERAQMVANTIGDVFSEQVAEVSPSTNAVTATVWERAALPNSPVSPNPARNGILALVLGGMLGLGLAFLLEHLDDRWRSPEEVEQISGVPTFGMIRAFEVPKTKTEAKKGEN